MSASPPGVDSLPFLFNVLLPLDQLDPQTCAEATLSRGLRTAEASAAAPSPCPRDSLRKSGSAPGSGRPLGHVQNPFRTLLRWLACSGEDCRLSLHRGYHAPQAPWPKQVIWPSPQPRAGSLHSVQQVTVQGLV